LKIKLRNVINQTFAKPYVLLIFGKTVGVPGRGSRTWHGFFFHEASIVCNRKLWTEKESSFSALGIGMENAFAVLKQYSRR